ncbi:MAG: c-type cytochrome [Candidatus Binataceae bacterium]
MNSLFKYLIAILIGIALALAIVILIVMPQMNWSATGHPSRAEKTISRYVLGRWVAANATDHTNPLPATADNLKLGREDYDNHCAVCHGYDGSARNLLHADFYPPVARLHDGAPDLSDGKIYFIISNGIRFTPMPGFGAHHSPEEIWRMILWVRHFPRLTAQEKADIATEMRTGPEEPEQASPGAAGK